MDRLYPCMISCDPKPPPRHTIPPVHIIGSGGTLLAEGRTEGRAKRSPSAIVATHFFFSPLFGCHYTPGCEVDQTRSRRCLLCI
ncbi:unnamed protein product [Linum trigynum]|uniref:Uncharacterized protein n=1 Tax=Linum trigynum TaxID=586398 RepID=A0AAV2FEL9_9ROSI